MKFSGNAQVEVYADFSGVVTQETLREALKGKENAFDKNSAFNKNFSGDAYDYMALGKKAHPGGSPSVARADHVHPLGTMLKFAENNWWRTQRNVRMRTPAIPCLMSWGTDVLKLITNLISNTTPKNAASNDPFWEKAEGMFLQSLFYYVWLEEPPAKRNCETVLKPMGEAEVAQKGNPSALDVRMKLLEEMSPLGENHPAVKQYNKCMRGAGDTVRSIIISANSRLATLENKQVLRLLSKDELNIAELGIGVNGDKKTKTALFCVIPDSDKTYNYIIGLLYTQIFQKLYYQADFNYGGKLPIHVTFMLDEFANVALPDDYCSLLSTMRSREISSVIIIQNLAQIKALFKDTWETVTGNCVRPEAA